MSGLFGSCFPPLRYCLECVQGPSFTATQSYAQLQRQNVRLDVSHMGKDVVILKEGERICGTGGATATVAIEQNKAYFQVCVQQNGVWGIGVGNHSANLNAAPVRENFWGICEDGQIWADGKVVGKAQEPIEEELKFLVNGEPVETSITGIRGQVFPLTYVDDSAILDVKFRNLSGDTPAGYDEILIEQTLL